MVATVAGMTTGMDITRIMASTETMAMGTEDTVVVMVAAMAADTVAVALGDPNAIVPARGVVTAAAPSSVDPTAKGCARDSAPSVNPALNLIKSNMYLKYVLVHFHDEQK